MAASPWVTYKGADGKDYWYNPSTDQHIDPSKVASYMGADGVDYWYDSASGTHIAKTDAPPSTVTPPRTVPVGTSDIPAPAPTAPAAPQYQHQGPTTGFSFGNLTGDQTVAYDDPSNRAVGWQKFSDYLNPNNTSANYGRWLNGQLGDQFARFNVSQFQDPKNTGNDWLSYLEKLAPGMRQQFMGLSSAQTGNNYGNYESGNWLG